MEYRGRPNARREIGIYGAPDNKRASGKHVVSLIRLTPARRAQHLFTLDRAHTLETRRGAARRGIARVRMCHFSRMRGFIPRGGEGIGRDGITIRK